MEPLAGPAAHGVPPALLDAIRAHDARRWRASWTGPLRSGAVAGERSARASQRARDKGGRMLEKSTRGALIGLLLAASATAAQGGPVTANPILFVTQVPVG